MKTRLKFLDCIHLDETKCFLSAHNTVALMAFFSYLDAHGFFSINDMQWWAFMVNISDMPLATIVQVFNLLDYDFTGEMSFMEFQYLCCCFIAAKDGVAKEFLARHFKQLAAIIDRRNRNYLSIREFCMMGALVGWDLGTLDRLYKFLRRDFYQERYRIYFKNIRFFLILIVEHERATVVRQRIKSMKDFRERTLMKLFPAVHYYFWTGAVPSPVQILALLDGVGPPTIFPMKEVKEERGCCEYCIVAFGIVMLLPCFIGYVFCRLAWWLKPTHFIIQWLIKILLLQPLWPFFRKYCIRRYDTSEEAELPLHRSLYYGRNKIRQKKPIFHYISKLRNEDGIFGREDRWKTDWLKHQLFLEQLEKQLQWNRAHQRQKEGYQMQDTYGVQHVLFQRYADKKLGKKYQPPFQRPQREPPSNVPKITINKNAPVYSKYPAKFLEKYHPHEIQLAEAQIHQKLNETRVFEAAHGKEFTIRTKLRNTVFGKTKQWQKEKLAKSRTKINIDQFELEQSDRVAKRNLDESNL